MSDRKKVIFYAVVIIVVVAVMAWAVWYGKNPNVASPSSSVNPTVANMPAAPSSSTRTAVPANAVVPDKGASNAPANVAVPVVQGAGDAAGNVSYRSFNITIANGAYNPDTVIVNQGDTVNLELTAVDASYGFDQPDYGFKVAIPEGKTQTIQFQALVTGTFKFYCASCGGPSKGPVGQIIVVPK